jgi:hypothetical protein
VYSSSTSCSSGASSLARWESCSRAEVWFVAILGAWIEKLQVWGEVEELKVGRRGGCGASDKSPNWRTVDLPFLETLYSQLLLSQPLNS